jgi:hypothetical protein
MELDATERMLIERECERLVTRYCHYIDHGVAERVVDLFTLDGVWRGAPVVMEGEDALRKGFVQRQANRARMSRHVCNNLLIDVVDADNARGTVYLTLYRHDGDHDRRTSPLSGPVFVGEYRDRFVRTPTGWRIAERELAVSFVRDQAAS